MQDVGGETASDNSLDGEALGDGTPGPLTTAIRDRFWALMDEPSALIEAIEY